MKIIAIEEDWTTAELTAALDHLPEASQDDSLAFNDRALRLIIRGTLDRHLDLQVVLGHWGQLLLF